METKRINPGFDPASSDTGRPVRHRRETGLLPRTPAPPGAHQASSSLPRGRPYEQHGHESESALLAACCVPAAAGSPSGRRMHTGSHPASGPDGRRAGIRHRRARPPSGHGRPAVPGIVRHRPAGRLRSGRARCGSGGASVRRCYPDGGGVPGLRDARGGRPRARRGGPPTAGEEGGTPLLGWEMSRHAGTVAAISTLVVHAHGRGAGLVPGLALRGRRLPVIFGPHLWSFEAVGRLLAGPARNGERYGPAGRPASSASVRRSC